MAKTVLFKTDLPLLVVNDRLRGNKPMFQFDEFGHYLTDDTYKISRAKGHFGARAFDTKEEALKHKQELEQAILKEREEENEEKEMQEQEEIINDEEVKQEEVLENEEESATEEVDLTKMKKSEIISYARKELNLKVNDRLNKDDLIIEIGKKLQERGE